MVTGDIKVMGGDDNTVVVFKNCHPFTTAIIRLNDEQVEIADSLDLTMSLYNMLNYSDNYSDTTGSLFITFIIIKDQTKTDPIMVA